MIRCSLLLVLFLLSIIISPALSSDEAPQFDLVTPLARQWELSRSLSQSMLSNVLPSGKNNKNNKNATKTEQPSDGPLPKSGKVKLTLTADNVAKFSSGEVGVWGVKKRIAFPVKGDYAKIFSAGHCLEIEVPSPDDGPILIYSLPLAVGQYQQSSLRLGPGRVAWLPGQISLKKGVGVELEARIP
jgi:hypothetical protein